MEPAPVAEARPGERSRAVETGRERAFGAAAVKTALVAGTALTLINHPGVVRLEVTPDLFVPCLLNYLVPFLVAGCSRHALLERLRTGGGRS